MLRINRVCVLGVLVSSVGATVQDAKAYVLSIQPPTNLTLVDGINGPVNITAGTINITGLIGYSQLDPTGITILDPLDSGDDVARQAEINSGVKMGLVEVDPVYEVLHFSGYFESSVLTYDAYFEGIVGVVGPDGPDDFTIFLPGDTTQPLKTQLSNLGLETMADNQDVFVQVSSLNTPTLQIAPTIGQLTPGVEVFTLTGDPSYGRPDWYVGIGGATDPGGSSGSGGTATESIITANMNPHGTGGSGGCIPGSICTTIWTGGTGNWTDASMWDYGLVPFNGNFSGTDFNAVIDGGLAGASDVTLSNNITIVNLTVSQGDSLTVTSGNTLTLEGNNSANQGTIILDGMLGLTTVTLLNITGDGEIILTDENTSRIGSGVNGEAMRNVGGTIRGKGRIQTVLNNEGVLRAEGGTLTLNKLVNNSGGDVEIASDAVLIASTISGGDVIAEAGALLNGGTLASTTISGELEVQSGTLQNASLSALGVIQVLGGDYLTLRDLFSNAGTVNLTGSSATGTATIVLNTSGPVTLSGGGEIIMSETNYARIGQGFNGEHLINADHTIRGSGTINSSMTNESLIRVEGGTMSISRSINNNAGVIEIASDGTLYGGSGASIIFGGTIQSADGAVLNGTYISDVSFIGDLDAVSGRITDSTMTAASTLDIPYGTLELGGTIDNQTTITVLGSSAIGTARLGVNPSDPVSLTGGGELVLTDGSYSYLGQGFVGESLTNVDNTIRGAGSVFSFIINQSTIRAGGGTLSFSKPVNNYAGTFEVAADGLLSVPQGLTGGTLTVDPAGSVSGLLVDVTNTGTLPVRPAAWIQPQNTLINQGSVIIYGSSATGTGRMTISTSNPVSLLGGGDVVLTDDNYTSIGQGFNGELLTNVDNTIRGAGFIFTDVINESLIRAEGGKLSINGDVDNTAGQVEIAADGMLGGTGDITGGSVVSADGGMLMGPTLISVDISGDLDASAGAITDSTLMSGGTLDVLDGGNITLAGSFTNQSLVTVKGSPSLGSARLSISSSNPVSLTGSGEVVLTDDNYSAIGQGFAGEELTNVDNTIRGAGYINSELINQSLVRAEGGKLTINKEVDNATGVFEVAADGTLAVSNGLVGGTLNTDAAGTVTGKLRDVTSTGSLGVRPGGSVTLEDSFVNQGVVTIHGSSSTGLGSLEINNSSPVTLTGGGEVILASSNYTRIGGGFAEESLINVDNTIRGEGYINSELTNQATLRAQNGTLTLTKDLLGTGDTFVDAGATLVFNGGTLQQQTLTVDPAGTFDFNGTRLEVVDFTGDFVQDSGTYAPGSSPAESTLNGGYQLASNNATLEIEIGGTALGDFDQLTVSGAVDLNGKLSIVSLPSYVPSAGDTFVVLKALGGLTGDFTTINGQIIGEGPGPGYQIILDYTSGTVTLQTTLPGDLNGDGFVGIADLNLVLGNWNLNVPPGDPLADPSGDGFVGIADLNVVLGNWNGDFPPATGAAAIPEPGTVGLVGLGVAALARHRARRGA